MKRTNKNRLRTYVPHVEGLESRMQPGSILTSGLSLGALGAALDQSLVSPPDASTTSSLHLSQNLSLNSASHAAVAGGTVAVTPYQVTHENTASNTSLTLSNGSSSSLGDLINNSHMAPVPTHVGASGSSVVQNVGSGGVTIQHQGAQAAVQQQHVTPALAATTPTPVAAPAPTVAPVSVQPVTNLKVTAQVATDSGHGKFSGYWASFASTGVGGFDSLAKVDLVSGSGSSAVLAAAGTATDPTDGATLDGYALVTPDSANSTSQVSQVVISNVNGSGFNTQLTGVAHDAAGNILVAGYTTASDGVTKNGILLSLTPNLSGVNWGLQVNDPSVLNGVAVSNGNVYAVGVDSVNFATGDLLALQTDTGGNVNYGFIYHFQDANGNDLGTIGNATGVDANTGNSDIAAQFIDTSNNGNAAAIQLDVNGNYNAGFFFTGLNAADSFNTVSVNSLGSAYYAGQDHLAGDNFSYMIVAGVAADGQTLLYQANGQGVAYLWYLINGNGQHAFNWVGNGNGADNSGNQTIGSTDDDGMNTSGSFGQLLFKLDATGANSTDFGDGGVNGSLNDYGNGVAIDSGNHVWEVGSTTSPDFTVNGFDTTSDGGQEGWIAGFTQP